MYCHIRTAIHFKYFESQMSFRLFANYTKEIEQSQSYHNVFV